MNKSIKEREPERCSNESCIVRFIYSMVQKYVCTYDFVLVSDSTKLWKLRHLVYNQGENYLCKSQVDK